MFADHWDDRVDHGIAVANPSMDQVRQAIAALDGQHKTLVSLADKEGSDHYMLVGGQQEGRFILNATKDNCDFFSLVDPAGSQHHRMLYVGGQDGMYEDRKCVPMVWALEAAEYFCETGELKPGMHWASEY